MKNLDRYEKLSAVDKLNYFRGQYYNDGNVTEKGIIANAINELIPMLGKIAYMCAIPYELEYTSTATRKRVAVFDARMISKAEVLEHIHAGELYNEKILYMSEKQFEGVFRTHSAAE